jgi:hypothetical protein
MNHNHQPHRVGLRAKTAGPGWSRVLSRHVDTYAHKKEPEALWSADRPACRRCVVARALW